MSKIELFCFALFLGFVIGAIVMALVFKNDLHDRMSAVEASVHARIRTTEITIMRHVAETKEDLMIALHLRRKPSEAAPAQAASDAGTAPPTGADTAPPPANEPPVA